MFGLTVNFPCCVSSIFCGQCLTMLNSVVHLGNYLLMNLANDLDNQMKSIDFLNRHTLYFWGSISQIVNWKLVYFRHTASVSMAGFCSVSVQGKLKLLKSLTIMICIKFGHSLMYHILLLFIWCLSLRMCIICCTYHRFLKFVCKAQNHDSVLVQSLFKCSVESYSNFIGYNFLYGSYHSRVYMTV